MQQLSLHPALFIPSLHLQACQSLLKQKTARSAGSPLHPALTIVSFWTLYPEVPGNTWPDMHPIQRAPCTLG